MDDWYQLDNTGKVFPATASKQNSNVFRVAVLMKAPIDPQWLQQAITIVRPKFPVFFVRLRKGLFWNYIESNPHDFQSRPETLYPTTEIASEYDGPFLMRILYSGSRLSLECEHAITDGMGALSFLKALIYYYLQQGKTTLATPANELVNISGSGIDGIEDSYLKYAKMTPKFKPAAPVETSNAYKLKGRPLNPVGHNVITGVLSAAAVNRLAHAKGTTVTGLLTALLMQAITQDLDATQLHRPIVIVLPVNLRAYFPSTTLRNFFGSITLTWQPQLNPDLATIITSLSQQLQNQLNAANLRQMIASNVSLARNKFVRFVPLVPKTLIVRTGFRMGGNKSTTLTFSNLGVVKLPADMAAAVANFEFVAYPSQTNPVVCNLVTFQDQLTLSFNRRILEPTLIRNFFAELKRLVHTDILIYSNDWGLK
ncbi:hypothetical protein FC83_GL003217 [Agrilactobacillus composti DSM 18527 = JCM 14202]|uniref:Phthiocerol/phthiodiolone dimycocerosyl transferase n=1 Tax=Agrilactobacillus composti DSM 18527 = JCM 14202 TaxID=1423734 RepID=X0QIU3_9LACO|nr:hypothetical protein [Agrilactobacillus composti]KRM33136.1 hypothetical protein FC83_GL003217 [Agrilactobacillus composti DSM 18527 = JCM 14202]GAF38500.1 hypothetical protein JCM14202_312 [Agrilactobacillus composti DSM 18527 = JCM 14202]